MICMNTKKTRLALKRNLPSEFCPELSPGADSGQKGFVKRVPLTTQIVKYLSNLHDTGGGLN